MRRALEGWPETTGETGPLSFYRNLGNALLRSGKVFEAAKAVHEAHSLYPNDARIMYLLGRCLWFEGNSLVAAKVVPIETFHANFWRIQKGDGAQPTFLAGPRIKTH